MLELWAKLESVLSDICSLYQAVLELGKQKRTVLVRADAKELEGITRQEERLILQIGKLETVRGETAAAIAANCGLNTKSLTLSTLVSAADPETAERLHVLAQRIQELAEEMVTVNEVNTQLLRQAIDFINFNINILAQNKAEPTYSPSTGSQPAVRPRGVFDHKV